MNTKWIPKSIIVVSTLLLFSTTAQGQEEEATLSIELGDSVRLLPSGQYRARYVFRGGYYDAFSQRARLGAGAQILEKFKLMIQMQDVRVWGEETNTLNDFSADGFGLHQAWAEAGCTVHGVSLRIGRQELAYDNQRLIGAVAWSDQARSFDAIRAAYNSQGGNLHVHAFYAQTGEEDAYKAGKDSEGNEVALKGSKRDTNLAGLWARYQKSRFIRPSFSAFYDWTGAKNQNRVTLGLFIDGAPAKGLTYNAEFYYQTGRTGDEKRKDISAFLAALGLGYRAPLRLRPSLGLWFEYLSGKSPNDTSSTVRSFDTLFATNHKFYGFMDFFLNIPVHTKNLGLVDVGGRLKIEPAKWLHAFIDYHHFELAREHVSGATTIGNELDLLINLRINKYFGIQGVFAVFFPKLGGAYLRTAGFSKETEAFGYLQTNLQF